MNITLEADYALRIVYCFAQNNVKIDAGTIADRVGVSVRFSLKILRKLLLAGIVNSYKGTQGGYALTKSPADISMYDVINAIQGDLPINRCTDSTYECQCPDVKDGMPCSMHKVFCELCEDLKAKLSKISFEALVKDCRK